MATPPFLEEDQEEAAAPTAAPTLSPDHHDNPDQTTHDGPPSTLDNQHQNTDLINAAAGSLYMQFDITQKSTGGGLQQPPQGRERIGLQVLNDLVEMGFSKPRAQMALRATFPQSSIQNALEWLQAHEDIQNDDELQEPAPAISPKRQLTKDEAEAKARELQKRLREDRIAREKQEERDREKQRIESSKVALEHQRKLDEEDKKRHLYQLQKDKLDHQKERERQRQLLKEEWEDRFGVPYVEHPENEPLSLEDEAARVAKKSEKDQIIYWCSKIKRLYKDSDRAGMLQCLTTIKTYASNAGKNPMEPKYHRIRKENAAFKSRVAVYDGALQLLQSVGFKDDGGEFYSIEGYPDGFILGQVVKFIDIILSQLG